MQTDVPFYIHKLQELLSDRQKRNSAYSLRAFAKDLEIDSSNLSAIFRRKRELPTKRAHEVASKLRLAPRDHALFVASTRRQGSKLNEIKVKDEAKQYLIDDKYFRIIAEWEYYAVLNLIEVKGFRLDYSWISKRLKIPVLRAKWVVNDLLSLKFVELDESNGLKRLIPSIETSENVESNALLESHTDSLRIAQDKLTEVPIDERDYSSILMAIDPAKLPEAKALIREFQDKLATFLTAGPKTEVYQLSCQLFPLTQKEV